MRYNCYSVGNYAKIIPRRAFPNSFDMFNGHTGKYHTHPCNGMEQPHNVVNTRPFSSQCFLQKIL